MVKIKIKPLSVNAVWQGKRYKTKAYHNYEKEMLYTLPTYKIPDGKLEAIYEFGFSSSASDIDNPVKPLQVILQKKYGFDDKRIHKLTVTKTKVKKGQEYIKFKIKQYEND